MNTPGKSAAPNERISPIHFQKQSNKIQQKSEERGVAGRKLDFDNISPGLKREIKKTPSLGKMIDNIQSHFKDTNYVVSQMRSAIREKFFSNGQSKEKAMRPTFIKKFKDLDGKQKNRILSHMKTVMSKNIKKNNREWNEKRMRRSVFGQRTTVEETIRVNRGKIRELEIADSLRDDSSPEKHINRFSGSGVK